MATLARISGFSPSLCSLTPPSGHQFTGLKAGENLQSSDACRVGSDGKVYRSLGNAVGDTAQVFGFTIQKTDQGQVATLYHDERINYSDNVVPGETYYASGTEAGQLVDTAPFSGAKACAYGLPGGRLQLIQAIY